MSKTYTTMESIEALDIDPKTFRRWLQKAGIDLEKQRSAIDDRIRYLTEDQLRSLAQAHGRQWPPAPRPAKEQLPMQPGAFKQLVTDLVGQQTRQLEEELQEQAEQMQGHSRLLADVIGHNDRLEKAFDTTEQSHIKRIQELEGARAADLEHINELERQLAVHAAQISSLLEQIQASSRPRANRRQRPAAQGEQDEASDLPGGLVPWRRFAELHRVPATTVQKAIESGRFTSIITGEWKQGRATIRGALDAQGRHAFYQHFHHSASWQVCPDCPHQVNL